MLPSAEAVAAPGAPAGRWAFTALRPVTLEDLAGYSPRELRLMRNEIYARHGRVFRSAALQAHFDAQSWYRKDPGFADGSLSTLETRNAAFIQRYER